MQIRSQDSNQSKQKRDDKRGQCSIYLQLMTNTFWRL